mmetsp:Transcript_14040/g.36172  ORF Transcript_14040/g.36172 Transcript_14040/m.36172 type:complete len:205 (-) Transcript_14040:350-964(-)
MLKEGLHDGGAGFHAHRAVHNEEVPHKCFADSNSLGWFHNPSMRLEIGAKRTRVVLKGLPTARRALRQKAGTVSIDIKQLPGVFLILDHLEPQAKGCDRTERLTQLLGRDAFPSCSHAQKLAQTFCVEGKWLGFTRHCRGLSLPDQGQNRFELVNNRDGWESGDVEDNRDTSFGRILDVKRTAHSSRVHDLDILLFLVLVKSDG